MKYRIKQLRKSLKLTQAEFGARVGIVGSSVTLYEKGDRIPSNAVVQSICREFNVREAWLRTGEEPMYNDTSDDLIAKVAAKHNLGPSGAAFLRVMVQLFETIGPDKMDEVLEKTIPQLIATSPYRNAYYENAAKSVEPNEQAASTPADSPPATQSD